MQILQEVIETAKQIHNANCVIVGGGVRDTLMQQEPNDYDLYYLDTIPKEIAKHFIDYKPADMHYNRHTNLVAEMPYSNTTIQVMTSRYTTTDELLDTCDWNVSAFAYDGTLRQREDIANIREGKNLKLLTIGNPISTLARGFKFSTRYNMIFTSRDVVRICSAVVGGKPRRKRRA